MTVIGYYIQLPAIFTLNQKYQMAVIGYYIQLTAIFTMNHVL